MYQWWIKDSIWVVYVLYMHKQYSFLRKKIINHILINLDKLENTTCIWQRILAHTEFYQFTMYSIVSYLHGAYVFICILCAYFFCRFHVVPMSYYSKTFRVALAYPIIPVSGIYVYSSLVCMYAPYVHLCMFFFFSFLRVFMLSLVGFIGLRILFDLHVYCIYIINITFYCRKLLTV